MDDSGVDGPAPPQAQIKELERITDNRTQELYPISATMLSGVRIRIELVSPKRIQIGSNLVLPLPVVGRITEEHLFEAEKSFPGIIEIYEGLLTKPMTFLQLVWIYEVNIKG